MIKFLKKTAHKIFGHHKHHDAHAPAPLGPVTIINPVMPADDVVVESTVGQPETVKPEALNQPVVTVTSPTVAPQPEVISEPKPVTVEKSRSHPRFGRRTKDTMREARVIEEKAKDIALELKSLHEEKAKDTVDINELQKTEIIRKAEAIQLKTKRQPQIYEGQGRDAFGLNGASIKSPFEDEKGNKKPVGERTKIMDSLQKGESTYKLKRI